MGDHPISWCQNYDGGRAFTQVLGHLRELWYDAAYLRNILGGIQTAAGVVPANCVSFREVREAAGALSADGGGRRRPRSSTAPTPPTRRRRRTTRPRSPRSTRCATLAAAARERRRGGPRAGAGQGQPAARVDALARRGPSTRARVGGTVPATLSLSLGHGAGVRRVHPRSGEGLRVHRHCDGHQHRGRRDAERHRSERDRAGPAGQWRLLAGAAAAGQGHQRGAASAPPTARSRARRASILNYAGPVSNDTVTLGFKQSIAANEPLRTGSYSKTITYTLSTTTP